MPTKKTDICPTCGNEYKNLSMHWNQFSSCNFPKLTDNQKDIVTGVLMGDGCVSRPGKNPLLSVVMINKDYLDHLDNVLGVYGKGVIKKMSASESAESNRNSGFRPNAKSENYSSIYSLNTRTSPEFEEFKNWYNTGEKVFPNTLKLNETIIKHWYVCDGTYANYGGKDRIEIAASNEIDRFDNIIRMFDNIGFEARTSGKTIYFSNSESKMLFNYMGKALPGFEYKWP